MAESKLSVVIQARDAFASAFKKLRSNLSGIGDVFNTVRRGAIVAGAAVAGVAFAFERLVTRGGKAAQVSAAFTRVTGNQQAALKELRDASRGLINDYDLMVGFNRALALGAAKNTAEFAELTKTAITLGRALGVDAAFALESLSLGIGRQSKLILDNLGLIVKVEDANKAYAKQLGVSVNALSESQKRHAFNNAAMEAARQKTVELGGGAETAADSIQRIKNQVVNAVTAFGQMLAQSDTVKSFFDRIADVSQQIVEAIGGDRQSIEDAFTIMGQAAANAFALAVLTTLKSAYKLEDAIWTHIFGERGTKVLDFLLGPVGGLSSRGETKTLDRFIEAAKANLAAVPEAMKGVLGDLGARGGGRGGGGGGGGGRAGIQGVPWSWADLMANLGPQLAKIQIAGGAPTIRTGFEGGASSQERLESLMRFSEANRAAALAQQDFTDKLAFARQILVEIRTPQEEYARAMQRLNDPLVKNMLTTDEYARAQQYLNAQLKQGAKMTQNMQIALIHFVGAVFQALAGGGGIGGFLGGALGAVGGIVSLANPVLGTGLATLGGIVSTLSARDRDKPVPVSVERYGNEALAQTAAQRAQDFRVVVLRESSDARETARRILELEQLDDKVRLPFGVKVNLARG